jgi:L-asparaginase/Glu-tRNA(Gln) amidotransferase subunit D
LPIDVPEFNELMVSAKEKEIVIVCVSDCLNSYNSNHHKKYLEKVGLVYAGDMTVEATVAKLSYLITQGLDF